MISKPVQSAPSFNSGLQSPMSAHLYFLKAKQAYADGQLQQASAFAQVCIAAASNDKKILFLATELLAESLTKMSQPELALAAFKELDRLKPNDVTILNQIGTIFANLNQYDESIEYFQRALNVQPADYAVRTNLGLSFYNKGDVVQAKVCYQEAIKINPKASMAKYNLAHAFQSEGSVDEARQAYEDLLAFEPQNKLALANLIFMQNNGYPLDMPRQMELVERFVRQVESDTSVLIPSTKKQQRLSHRPLRIGFVSADFRFHPIAFFLESTLAYITVDSKLRDQLTLVAYSNWGVEDGYTAKIRSKFDLWHNVESWTDDLLVEQIKRDQIDILIDLSGYTKGQRLNVFVKKVAPLQISWLGYFGTTGLSSIDYVLADNICVPANEEHWFSEKIWRLPHLRYCLSIPRDAPEEVSSLPCISDQKMVFGCYQTLTKINKGVMQCWQKVLDRCPQACLRIQSREFEKQEIKNLFIERMRQVGLDLNRIKLVGEMGYKEYLTSYAEVDILLDTFPFPGGTTTAEALWMGVPTLTLAMPSMLGRQGEALMVNAGLSDWVAYSEEEYVKKAISWGNADLTQRQNLAKLRAGMREQVKESPVFNAKQFAGEFVDALYGMWREKCGV